MLRVSKTLLCALVADASLASRQTGAMVNVMDSIGSLMQGHKSSSNGAAHSQVLNNLRLLASITPGQTDSLNTALKTVIDEIERNVDTKIKASFFGTQSTIEDHISKLEHQTNIAVSKKETADNADNTWFNCVGGADGEKEQRQKIEEADAAQISSRSNSVEACQVEQDTKGFENRITLTSFSCNIAEHANCVQQVENYRSTVTGLVTALKEDFAEKQNTYNIAYAACEASKEDLAQKQSAHSEQVTSWSNKRNECLTNKGIRQQAICNFGSNLQTKCSRKRDYDSLLAEVDQVNGGEHSDPDREQEWTTTSVTKCMLKKIIDGHEINGDVLDACHQGVNFAEDVGVLDRKTAQYNDATSAAKFSCTERTIKFPMEYEWHVPQGENPRSDEYTRVEFNPSIDLDDDVKPAFSWCRGDGDQAECAGKGAKPEWCR